MSIQEFSKLTPEQQTSEFERIKQAAGYREKSILTHFYADVNGSCNHDYYHTYAKRILRGYIHRPFKLESLPAGWAIYKPYFEKEYPEGEDRLFHAPECDVSNYAMLYHWIQGHCMKCQTDTLVWDEGDKHVEYVCTKCYDETPFFKHWRAYY